MKLDLKLRFIRHIINRREAAGCAVDVESQALRQNSALMMTCKTLRVAT